MARIAESAITATESGPVQGMIPAVDTINGERVVHLIPWNKGSRQHSKALGQTQDHWALPAPTETDLTQELIATLPPEQAVPHRERFRLLCRQLLDDRLKLGHWPASVEADIRAMGWRSGKPTLLQEVEQLASKYIVEAANRQKEHDSHQVATDGRGHYSA